MINNLIYNNKLTILLFIMPNNVYIWIPLKTLSINEIDTRVGSFHNIFSIHLLLYMVHWGRFMWRKFYLLNHSCLYYI